MKAILGFVAYNALLVAVPLYGNFIYDRFKAGERRRGWKHTFFALLVVSAIFVLGYYGWIAQTAKEARKVPKLEYFNKGNLEEEVNLRRQKNLLNDPHIEQTLQIIKVKFDDAQYAQDKNDFERALQLYTEIQRGSDENGTFDKFPSACIENNMALDLFRKQGDKDKGFKASSLLLDALRLDPKPQHHLDVIQRNVEALDQYINQ